MQGGTIIQSIISKTAYYMHLGPSPSKSAPLTLPDMNFHFLGNFPSLKTIKIEFLESLCLQTCNSIIAAVISSTTSVSVLPSDGFERHVCKRKIVNIRHTITFFKAIKYKQSHQLRTGLNKRVKATMEREIYNKEIQDCVCIPTSEI